MPPKTKITKDDIINKAIGIVRTHGASGINARTIAAELNCSTQPIYSNFETMDDLHAAIIEHANERYHAYINQEINSSQFPSYKASGMAYIRFAKEEKELFKLLFMRDRTNTNDVLGDESFAEMVHYVQSYTGLNESDAALFHLELWAVVHGIATMYATGFLDLDRDLVSKIISDTYFGLRKQYEME